MSTHATRLPRPRLPRRNRGLLRAEEIVPWSIADRVGLAAAWFCGLLLCAIAGSIVIYMLVRGLQFLSLDALVEHPISLSTTQITGTAGGYLAVPLVNLDTDGATTEVLRCDQRRAASHERVKYGARRGP